jgi:hypothetical protein
MEVIIMTELEERALNEGWLLTEKGAFIRNGHYGCRVICKTCGREFIGSLKTVKYCCDECKPPNKKTKVTYTDLLKLFNDEGYDVLTTKEEWDNRKQDLSYYKVKFICPNGHEYIISYKSFRVGQRCKLCSKSAPVYWSDVIDLFEKKKGWTVLTKESEWKYAYKDRILFKCSQGHIYSYTYTSLKHLDSNCPYCSHMVPIKFEDIKKSFEDEGWTVLSKESEYKSQNETPIRCICPNGHVQDKNVRKWRMGRRCPYCVTSGPELELKLFIEESVDIEYIPNYRGLGVELDIFFPSINKAIEFNGNYWHCNPTMFSSDYLNKHKNLYAHEIWQRDEQKKFLCMSNNIDLMTIWEDEWNRNNINVKKSLLSFIV